MSSQGTGLFRGEIRVINVGLPSFAEELRRQGVPVVHVSWLPPAGGNKKVLALLDRVQAWQERVKSTEASK